MLPTSTRASRRHQVVLSLTPESLRVLHLRRGLLGWRCAHEERLSIPPHEEDLSAISQALTERFKPGLEPDIELFMKLMFASGVVWDHKPKMGVLPLPEEALSLAPQELINLLIEMLEAEAEADEEAEEDAE